MSVMLIVAVLLSVLMPFLTVQQAHAANLNTASLWCGTRDDECLGWCCFWRLCRDDRKRPNASYEGKKYNKRC